MIESLYIAASGLQSHQRHVDVISHNVANINTPAFKKERLNFSELLSNVAMTPGAGSAPPSLSGVSVNGVVRDFAVGGMQKTDRTFDVAIQGAGFFEVVLESGDLAYTRFGGMDVSPEGTLQINGNPLSADIRIPLDASQVVITESGDVLARVGEDQEPVVLGRLDLANFANANELESIGGQLYLATDDSGEPYFDLPTESGLGGLAQGYLEAANVDLVSSLTDLVAAQRAFSLSARMVQAADQMMATTNELRP